ncbi:MAG: hypothetical protein AAGE93_26080 [Bacteroidota bacterium]
MAKAYRFDDTPPRKNTTVNAFRTLNALLNFARWQGSRGAMKFWEITGIIVKDDGGLDGIEIRVQDVVEIEPNQQTKRPKK